MLDRSIIIYKLNEKMAPIGRQGLFSCEAGSRAWGVPSTNSDYDIRFIYVRPRNEYLSLTKSRDVMEWTDDLLDFSGWDLKKALFLASKSNPALLEWIHSPIIYASESLFTDRLSEIMLQFSPRALMHHYVSLASRQHKAYWKIDRPVRLKKYIYAVRPLMAVYWMADNGYNMPPVNMKDLITGTFFTTVADSEILKELTALLDAKAHTTEEMGTGRYKALDDFIAKGLTAGHAMADIAPDRKPDIDALQELFLDVVNGEFLH